MTSPITLFAPLATLQDVGSLASPTSRTAQNDNGVVPARSSTNVDWSATPGTQALRQSADVYIANINEGISLAQTASTALDRAADALRSMRALTVHAGNATPDERLSLEPQFEALGAAVRRVLDGARADGRAILGADADSTAFRVGAGTDDTHLVTVNTHDLLGSDAMQAVTSGAQASIAAPVVPPALAEHLENVIAQLDLAAAQVNEQRNGLAAAELRFDSALAEMFDAALEESRAGRPVVDAGNAATTAHALSGQIMQGPGQALFALANPASLRVLGLLAPG